jgi:hypothetical protein
MEVRRGEVPLTDALDEIHRQAADLERVTLSSNLPEEPDMDAIDQFLVSACERMWAAP